MALEQITIQVTGTIVCGVGGPCMAAGDSVRINLDQTLYPSLPDYINGVVQQPVTPITLIDQQTQLPVAGTQYIIEYEANDLNGIIPALQACDVTGLECVTCCDLLNDRVDGLEEDIASLLQDTVEGVPNILAGTLQAFALIDQPISNVEEAVDFDTTEHLSGCLTRSGSVFTTSLPVRLNVSLRLQLDQLDVANVLTVWTKVNGVISARSALNISSGVLNSNTPETYTFSVPLAADDTVEFFVIASVVDGANLDFTAAAGAIPTIPAASVLLEAGGV